MSDHLGQSGAAAICQINYGQSGDSVLCQITYGQSGDPVLCQITYGQSGDPVLCQITYGQSGAAALSDHLRSAWSRRIVRSPTVCTRHNFSGKKCLTEISFDFLNNFCLKLNT